jgi:hypothetical protein
MRSALSSHFGLIRPEVRLPPLADDAGTVHTLTMTLKSAAFLALIGTILVTLLLVVGLADDILGVARGVVPEIRLVTSFIYAFAATSVAVFFYVFHKMQP